MRDSAGQSSRRTGTVPPHVVGDWPTPTVVIPSWVLARLMSYACDPILDDGTSGDEWAYLEACEAMMTQAPDEAIPPPPLRRLRLVKR